MAIAAILLCVPPAYSQSADDGEIITIEYKEVFKPAGSLGDRIEAPMPEKHERYSSSVQNNEQGEEPDSPKPSKPILKNFLFERQTWHWGEYDSMIPGSWLSFDIEYDGNPISFTLSYMTQEVPPLVSFFPWFNIDDLEVSEDGHSGYDADWGEYFQITAYYEHGSALSDVYYTTDYITDPDILARIKELQDIRTEVPTFENPEHAILISDDRILMSEDVRCLEILDVSGHKWYSSSHSSGAMDLQWLPSGTYVVRAVTADSKCETLKYLKR